MFELLRVNIALYYMGYRSIRNLVMFDVSFVWRSEQILAKSDLGLVFLCRDGD